MTFENLNPWYDDSDAMLSYTTSISNLRELFSARRSAGYDRKERLQEWCVLGRWYLDTCGNCMRIIEGIPNDLINTLPKIISWKHLFNYLPKDSSVSNVWTSDLPNDNTLCPHCNNGWSINLIDDIFIYEFRGDRKFYHKKCWNEFKFQKEKANISEIFKLAGFSEFGMEEIPNEYCPCEQCPPWWKVWTTSGVIKIGQRKRVINIDWDGSLFKTPDFSKEDVTQGPSFIHAWSKDKAVEYLKKLRTKG